MNESNPGKLVFLDATRCAILRTALNHLLARQDAGTDATSVRQLAQEIEMPQSTEDLRALLRNKMSFTDAVLAFGESATESPWVQAARGKVEEGELEVDETAVVSLSDDGAYVSAWVFVSTAEAGQETTSDLVKVILDYARETMSHALYRIAVGSTAWDTERVKRVAAYCAWLQETLENFHEEIDEAELPVVTKKRPMIDWAYEGVTYTFNPLKAISELVALTRNNISVSGRAERLHQAANQCGQILNANLVSIPLADAPAGAIA